MAAISAQQDESSVEQKLPHWFVPPTQDGVRRYSVISDALSASGLWMNEILRHELQWIVRDVLRFLIHDLRFACERNRRHMSK
jgi:hypothetical protein